MTTIAAGSSATFTIPLGQVATISGTGVAVLIYPTSSPIALTGKSVIGPFGFDRIVTMTAFAQIDYTVAVPTTGTGTNAALGILAKPVVASPATAGTSVGATLSVVGTPTPTTAVQWVLAGADVSGATSIPYASQASDAGKTLALRVTATNTFGTVTSTSDAVTVVAGVTGAPNAPTISSVAARGANSGTVTLVPSGSGSAATSKKVVAYRGGVVDTSVIDITNLLDPTNGPNSNTRFTRGQIAGVAYTYVGIASNASGDSPASAQSASLTLPVYVAAAPALSSTGYLAYVPGLPTSAATSTASAVTTKMMLVRFPDHISSLEVFAVNTSLSVSGQVSMSFAPVTTAGSLGSTAVGGNSPLPATSNGLNWSATATITQSLASARGDDAFAVDSFGAIATTSLTATDFPTNGVLYWVRLEYAVGAAVPFANFLANSAALSGSQDIDIVKEDPSVSNLGYLLMRGFQQDVAGVTTKTAVTSSAQYRPQSCLAAIFKYTLRDGAKGVTHLFTGDSRQQFTTPVTHSTAGAEAIAIGRCSTMARPLSYINLGAGGFGPSQWLSRLQGLQAKGLFTSGIATAFVPTSSINGWGGSNPISNFTSNADSADSTAALFSSAGVRVVRSTVQGVDYYPELAPQNSTTGSYPGSYNWGTSDVTVREGDLGVGVARPSRSNLEWEERAGTATGSTPVIALGSMSQGLNKNSVGAWLQADKVSNESWISFNGATAAAGLNEPTRAHYTYNWASKFSNFYDPYLLN